MKKLLSEAAALLKGRWQIPLALVAAVTGVYALLQLRPEPPKLDLPAIESEIARLEKEGRYTDAINAAANVLVVHPELPLADQSRLHRRLAELLEGMECAREEPLAANAQLLLTHEEAARQSGAPITIADRLRVAQAREWLGQTYDAVDEYRRALEEEGTPEQRRTARLALVRLLDDRPDAAAERDAHLREILEDDSTPTEVLWWALQRTLGPVLDGGDAVAARRLIERYGGALGTSDVKGYLEYLNALILVHEGRYDEATPVVRWIDEWLDRQSMPLRAMDEAGFLPAMNRWLMGRIHVKQMQPQDALAALGSAMDMHPAGDLRAAILAERGAALALLERHEPALEALQAAIDELRAAAIDGHNRAAHRLRDDLVGLYESAKARGYGEAALGYLKLAASLAKPEDVAAWVDLHARLGQAYADAADAVEKHVHVDAPGHDAGHTTEAVNQEHATAETHAAGDSHAAADSAEHASPDDHGTATNTAMHVAALRAAAGREYELAADQAVLEDTRFADLLWTAADLFDRGGALADAERVLKRFVDSRSSDPRLPAALLKLGQVCDAAGRIEDALRWYGLIISQFPRLQEAAQAKLRSADGLAALGAEREAEAEELLRSLLEADDIAPSAVVFRDGLLRLCELLHDQERFAEAIGRIEQFLTLYPQDPDRERISFLLADAYRRSAAELQAKAAGGGPDSARYAAEAAARFRHAAGLFAALVNTWTADDPESQTYRRLALFHEADCLFEVNDPTALGEALAIYRQAATRYERDPAALAAQVQIANIFLRQGKTLEAARAIERARWLLRNIPDATFAAQPDGADRASWENYLATIAAAPLLREELARAR